MSTTDISSLLARAQEISSDAERRHPRAPAQGHPAGRAGTEAPSWA